MKKIKWIKCNASGKRLYDDEMCWFQQNSIVELKKDCLICVRYKSLHPENLIEDAIKKFYETTNVPEENVKFYRHIYKKIKEAIADSKSPIERLQDRNNDFLKVLQKDLHRGLLDQGEADALSQLREEFINKEENKGKLSIKRLKDYFITKRINPGLEFLSRALVKDAEEFGGKPFYKEVSKLLVSIGEGDSNTVATLKDKYPILKIPGLKFDTPIKVFKVELIINTLIATKTYFDAKGESFLPNPRPNNPGGYVKIILQILATSEEKIPKSLGIPIPIP